ncbi:MAG: FAD-dependent oxidoreductase [Ilumatobacteraceae bacterium]
MLEHAGRSLWEDTLPGGERVTILASTDDRIDVAVVGAGFTGLWTAWYLLQHDPSLRVTVFEREHVGFGASGRNGGWCSALLPMSLSTIAGRHGDAAAIRMQRAMHHTVREVGRFVDGHGEPSMLAAGGTIDVARSAPQAERLQREIAEFRRFGFGPEDYRWMERDEAVAICNATSVSGALHTPHCAAIHPLRLVHALARAVVAAGGTIREGVTVRSIAAGRLETSQGDIRADVIVRATEAYTVELAGERRAVLPIYSLMIATEPLPDDVWAEIGLDGRPTFADGRHMIIYGQRTHDGRFAFGGRGAPYHFGSRIDRKFDTDDRIGTLLFNSLRALFPMMGDAAVTHHWGGVLAAPRDWACGVRFDRRTGLATAGGYVGDGVATTNLAGRTLAALITDSTSDDDRELVRLPWVGHRSKRWEPEPFRWIGVNAGRTAALLADRSEARTGRPSRGWGGLVDVLIRR